MIVPQYSQFLFRLTNLLVLLYFESDLRNKAIKYFKILT